jgi:hypothetical protein
VEGVRCVAGHGALLKEEKKRREEAKRRSEEKKQREEGGEDEVEVTVEVEVSHVLAFFVSFFSSSLFFFRLPIGLFDPRKSFIVRFSFAFLHLC